MIRPFTRTLLVLMTAVPAASALAATSISECGTIVTEPGDYILTQDLFCAADQQGIWIFSSDVTLNLDGHTVTCDTSGDSRIGAVLVGNYDDPGLVLENVTVRNGTATRCDDGVALFYTQGVEVTNMYFYDNVEDGLVLVGAANTLAQHIKSTRSIYGIVSWAGTGNTFRDNRLAANVEAGIWAWMETGSQFFCNRSTFNEIGIGANEWGSENVIRGNITNLNQVGILLWANGVPPDVVLGPVWDNVVEDNIALGNSFADLADAVDDGGGAGSYFLLPECVNTWANNHFVSAIGPTDCNFVPVPMHTVDVCGMATGVLTPSYAGTRPAPAHR